MTTLRRWMTVLVVGLALAVGLLVMARWVFVRQMLYPAPPVPVPRAPAPLAEVALDVAGAAVVAWHHAAPGAPPATPAVVFLHGNGENLGTMAQSGIFGRMRELGVHFLVVDYPGYGRSGGRPSEASLVAAARAGLDWLARRHPGAPLVPVGWSLGAAVAAQVAAGDGVDGVVLLAPWDSLRSLAARYGSSLPAMGYGLPEVYDSLDAAGRIRVPALVVHGADDWVIPVEHGRRLHAALGDGARWLEIPSTGHDDLLSRRAVWDAIAAFLRGLPPRGTPASTTVAGGG